MAALDHSRKRLEADIERAAVAGKCHHLGRPALLAERRFDARGDRRGVLEQRVNPGDPPRRLRPRRREDFEATGRIGDDDVGPGRLGDETRCERLAAALAGPMPGLESAEPGLAGAKRLDVPDGLQASAASVARSSRLIFDGSASMTANRTGRSPLAAARRRFRTERGRFRPPRPPAKAWTRGASGYIGESSADLGRDDRPRARRYGALEHDQIAEAAHRLFQRFDREGAERAERHQTDRPEPSDPPPGLRLSVPKTEPSVSTPTVASRSPAIRRCPPPRPLKVSHSLVRRDDRRKRRFERRMEAELRLGEVIRADQRAE